MDEPTTESAAEPNESHRAATVDAVASILERVAGFIRRHPKAVLEFTELVIDAQSIGLGAYQLLHGAGI